MRWKEEEKSFLIENHGKMSDKDIANTMRRTENAIKVKIQRFGLAKRKIRYWSEKEIEFSNTKKWIIDMVSSLLTDFGITHTFRLEKRIPPEKDCWDIYICSKENYLKFIDNIGFTIWRKQERLIYLPKPLDDPVRCGKISEFAQKRSRDDSGRFIPCL